MVDLPGPVKHPSFRRRYSGQNGVALSTTRVAAIVIFRVAHVGPEVGQLLGAHEVEGVLHPVRADGVAEADPSLAANWRQRDPHAHVEELWALQPRQQKPLWGEEYPSIDVPDR